ncbi:MAG TPA: response regulator [Candidatus Saccharimonadales bacterium]|nr:response regulator [Candidatus Saccharimonadales bacterium]
MDQSFPQPKIQSDGEPYILPTHSKLILMVEDDDNLAKVYLMRFKAEGFDVKRANNGEDALAAATQYHPDLILLDVMMPKISGFDVLDILRNTPETANIKVIMLTALGQETDRKKAENLGVDDYLVKSEVVLNDIIQDIKRVLSI